MRNSLSHQSQGIWRKREMTSGVPFWYHAYLHKETIPAAPLLTFSPGIHRENETEKNKKCYLCRNVGRGFRVHPISRLQPNKLQWIKIVQVIWRNAAQGPLPFWGSPNFRLIPSVMPCFGKVAKMNHRKKGFNFSFTKTLSIVSKIHLSLWIKSLCKKLISTCLITSSLLQSWAGILRNSQRLDNASAGPEGAQVLHSTALSSESRWLSHPRFRVKRKGDRTHSFLSLFQVQLGEKKGREEEACLVGR